MLTPPPFASFLLRATISLDSTELDQLNILITCLNFIAKSDSFWKGRCEAIASFTPSNVPQYSALRAETTAAEGKFLFHSSPPKHGEIALLPYMPASLSSWSLFYFKFSPSLILTNMLIQQTDLFYWKLFQVGKRGHLRLQLVCFTIPIFSSSSLIWFDSWGAALRQGFYHENVLLCSQIAWALKRLCSICNSPAASGRFLYQRTAMKK